MTIDQAITLSRASDNDYQGLTTLLTSVNLPIEDLPGDLTNFVLAKQDDQIIGSAGLEILGPFALLRSLAVHVACQGKGIGNALYQSIITVALEKNIKNLYLITTTADQYFEKLGFKRIDRAKVPEAIQQTAQFSDICPASSVVMMKKM